MRSADGIAPCATQREAENPPGLPSFPAGKQFITDCRWSNGSTRVPIADQAELRRQNIDHRLVAKRLFETFAEQVLVHGIFHADPHPRNILVQPEAKLVLLDFGMVKTLGDSFRVGLAELILAILSDDKGAIADAFRRIGFRTESASPYTFVTLADLFLGSLVRRGKSYVDEQLIADFIIELPRALRSNPLVAVPGDIIFVVRTMGLLNGLARSLDSRVDLKRMLWTNAIAASAQAGIGEGSVHVG